MRRLLLGLCLLFASRGHALPFYYQFEHDLEIAGHHFSAVIILPSFYKRHFGILEELDYELAEQSLHPISDEKIFKTLNALQGVLWKEYENSSFLNGKSLWDPEFSVFRSIEDFINGRSALFAVVEKEKNGALSDVPFTLEAMVRMSSPVDLTATEPIKRIFQARLPCQLRAMTSPEGAVQLQRYSPIFNAEFKNRPTGYVPVFLEPQAVLGRSETEVACWQGAPLELKAWYHKPKILKAKEAGKPNTQIIDFLPDLLEIALMYGGFDRTGISTASLAHDSNSAKNLEQVIRVVSALSGAPATPNDIGVRAGEFWTEVIELPLANREREVFDMDLRLEFDDPDFRGFKNHVLWTTRERLLPALWLWANKRPGAALLPLSRLIVHRRSQRGCVRSLLHPGVKRLAHPAEQVQAIGIYVK